MTGASAIISPYGIINSGLTATILTREGGALSSFTIHDLIGKTQKEE